MIKCPQCMSRLIELENGYICNKCNIHYPLREGIVCLSKKNKTEYHFSEDYFDKLYSVENSHFWFRVRNLIISNAVKDYLPKGSNILEVGCGTGYVSQKLKQIGFNVECGDLFFKGLQYSKKRDSGNKYYQFNLYDSVFEESFDAVGAFDVIEHIEYDKVALKNIYDALKPNGILFLTVPASKKLWSTTDELSGHKRRYSANELSESVEKAGFKVIKLSYFMAILFPFIYLSRQASKSNLIKKHLLRRNNQPTLNEMQINPLVNNIFYALFRMEVPLINKFDLPFGSSLLCVAVKK